MKLGFISAACAALALTGCSSIDNGITGLATTLSSPVVQKATITVKTLSTALVCDVSAGSAVAKSIEAQVGAHQGVTNTVDVVSSTVCASLQGTIVAGVTEKNVPALTAAPTVAAQ